MFVTFLYQSDNLSNYPHSDEEALIHIFHISGFLQETMESMESKNVVPVNNMFHFLLNYFMSITIKCLEHCTLLAPNQFTTCFILQRKWWCIYEEYKPTLLWIQVTCFLEKIIVFLCRLREISIETFVTRWSFKLNFWIETNNKVFCRYEIFRK